MNNSGLLKAVTLASVGGGVPAELFEREIAEVAKNINDPNTTATAKRKITLTFSFQPDAERREVAIFIEAKTVIAPVRPAKNTVYCGKLDGIPTIIGNDPEQMEMELHSEDIRPIRKPYKEDEA
jgi:hypothetical protein